MRFISDFPGGNGRLLSAERREWGWEISFAAETKAREPLPLWFWFRLEELDGEKVRLHFQNSACALGDSRGWAKNRPVWRAGGPWRRAESVESRWTDRRLIDTWFDLPAAAPEIEAAFCYPYQQADLEETLSALPEVEPSVIGCTAQGRPLLRLASNWGDEARSLPGIYFIARQHAGETTGSYMMDGMLRFLATPEGREIQKKYVLWFVPFADTDGVEQGWYGKDQQYGDLNRAWGPLAPRRPEIRAIAQDLRTFREICRPLWVFDLHAPGHNERASYLIQYSEGEDSAGSVGARDLQARINARLRAVGVEDVGLQQKPRPEWQSRQGWMLRDLCMDRGDWSAVFECSYQGDGQRDFTEADYRAMGRILLQSALEGGKEEDPA